MPKFLVRLLTSVLAPAVALLPLAGCASSAASLDDERPVVLTTFTVLADMAQVVAGPDARVESITGLGMEIHGYEPTPDDLRRASQADLLLANGLGLEAWLTELVAPLDLPTVVLTDGIEPVPIGQHGGPLNPHAWMSPRAGQEYVSAIVRALGELDPGSAAAYRERGERYRAELARIEQDLTTRLADVPHKVLVTCEGAFSYLARDAGLAEHYLWPVNSERQGTPRQVASVILAVRETGVPVVFCESTVSPTAQQQVARETGTRLGGTLYVDSLSEPDGDVPTYLALLEHDIDVILAGLAS